jgi:hypothetical protein
VEIEKGKSDLYPAWRTGQQSFCCLHPSPGKEIQEWRAQNASL